MEVPEIYEKIVRIEASAREAGARSKIAVSSRDRDVDPVGACVGMKGSRVQAVVQELRGEKIDIVPYDGDPAKFVCNAIAPAEVSRVLIDVGSHTMELIVPDEKLSLAIGKKGQNVRLASQLTGWRIDIHSATKVGEMEQRARQSLAAIDGATAELAEALFKAGWRSASEVAAAKPDELAAMPGIGGAAGGAEVHRGGRSCGRDRADAARRRGRPRRASSARAAVGGTADHGGPLSSGSIHHAPIRTCAGCRRRGPAGDMFRLTLETGTLRASLHRKGSGRGASVHRQVDCVQAVQRPGVLARAFKRPVELGEAAAETFSQLIAVSRRQGTT